MAAAKHSPKPASDIGYQLLVPHTAKFVNTKNAVDMPNEATANLPNRVFTQD